MGAGATAKPVNGGNAPRSRRVLVTGAASGIGLEASRELARGGDHVIVADRDVAGGETAVQRMLDAGGSAEFRRLDLGICRTSGVSRPTSWPWASRWTS